MQVAEEHVALPVAGHRAVVGFGRGIGDVDDVTHHAAPAQPGVASGLAQRAAGAQAAGQLAAQRASGLDISDW